MTHPNESFDTLDTDSIDYEESFIDMKCTHCGYEEKMPEWCYAEEADFLSEFGDPEPPLWQCPKCHKDTLSRKPTVSILI